MPFIPACRPIDAATGDGWHFGFVDGQLLVAAFGGEVLLPRTPWPGFTSAPAQRHYLGGADGVDCWACALDAAPPGWRAMPLRGAMMQLDAPTAAIAGRAAQVLEWDRAHRHCGVCGTPTERQADERARVCPACRHVAYPRISPVAMALVWRDGELLLARSPHFVAGMYSALAGFVEAGESLEECLRREVEEEVGVQVGAVRYYASQSWPFPHSLMVAFTARWTGGEIVPQADEIEDAGWFPIDALPGIPAPFSIAGRLIRDSVVAMRNGTLQR